MPDRYLRPGWFTTNVFNRIVAGLIRLGVSVLGSRVLEVRGRTSGEPRRVPVNLLTVEGGRYLVAPRGEGMARSCSDAAASRSPQPSSTTTRSHGCCGHI